ncbi:tRNA (adenosine(37)-N6)-dimethylallyltransferase MiaA [Candidatus Riesia pediculischaeffi]|nr:tRNA (adenosine(37)-N6)-dimethylallyltransferase MiaA [Candidatus Riesia pediculischaeffi]
MKKLRKKKIIFIMGPTACGKTELAMILNRSLPVRVISVDSCLIYKGLDIGTSKPTIDQLRSCPHQLIDIIDPSKYYSVSNFQKDANVEIERSILLERIPLLIGGTMLYFRTLLGGLDPSLPNTNPEVRSFLHNLVRRFGIHKTFFLLKKVHPRLKKMVNFNDSQRMLRAMEVFLISGKNIEEFRTSDRFPYFVLQIAIFPRDKFRLHRRIEGRFLKMLKNGLEEEVSLLCSRGDLDDSFPSIRSIGYRQMWLYLCGKIDYDKMVYESIRDTKNFAKKQMTWIKSWKNVKLFDVGESSKILEKIAYFIDT